MDANKITVLCWLGIVFMLGSFAGSGFTGYVLREDSSNAKFNFDVCFKELVRMQDERISCNDTNINFIIPENMTLTYDMTMDFGENAMIFLNQTNALADKTQRIQGKTPIRNSDIRSLS